jgi:hypothetical protein
MNRKLGIGFALLLAFTFAGAQNWAPLNNQPTFLAGTALLLTDGTVMVQEMTAGGLGTGNWWKLTPDNMGSYRNGTWTQLATMPSMPNVSPNTGSSLYAPLYYASAVLPDKRVIIMGGERDDVNNESTRGAIYDPAFNTWTPITPPPNVTQIGDASGVVLPNGTFMLGPCCGATTDWLLDPTSLTWTATGAAGKADGNTEEGWTLLPNGNVLTVDTTNVPFSEVFNPSSGSWSSAGNTILSLPSSTGQEIGPAVLRPDGAVFAVGGNSNTAVYGAFGTWSMGPQIPGGQNGADVPAALLTNGRVLLETADHFLDQGLGTHFYEFDGNNLTAVVAPPTAGNVFGFVGRMLVLPTGEIMFTNQTAQVELYTSSGSYLPAWQPTISSISNTSLGTGLTYTISGTQFNGLSQGAMYGDDAQSATNYPLVRITNNGTGHVFYMRTHDHSTMAVATSGTPVSTMFDVPLSTEVGDSMLQVVVNGIPSNPIPVTVFLSRRRACCIF